MIIITTPMEEVNVIKLLVQASILCTERYKANRIFGLIKKSLTLNIAACADVAGAYYSFVRAGGSSGYSGDQESMGETPSEKYCYCESNYQDKFVETPFYAFDTSECMKSQREIVYKIKGKEKVI